MNKLQITINNDELYKTIMSISKNQRGQFVSMALAAFIDSDEGQRLVNSFAKHKPSQETINAELNKTTEAVKETYSKKSGFSVLGDFGE